MSKVGLTSIEMLERELSLKQLQVNRLLDVTQAINNNLPAPDLFKIYKSILSWEMVIKKMALFIKEENHWICATSINVEPEFLDGEVGNDLMYYDRLTNITDKEHPLISQFDIIIPVYHKKMPIAFTLLGDFEDNDDLYDKVKFITTITNIIAVAIENKRLFKRQLEQERLKREMELAGEMQHMLIPDSLPVNERFEFNSIYMPHLGVGGDYFDFIRMSDEKFAFCVADISGKGVAAALLMANFQANIRTLTQPDMDMVAFIKRLNKRVMDITKGDKFITFFFAEYCMKTRTLHYVNAGHNPPLLVMNNEVHLLKEGCTILGSFTELPVVDVGEVVIDSEAMIIVYTDGLTDLRNDEDEFFDNENLSKFVLSNHHFATKTFNEKLIEQINIFKGEQAYPDDIAVLTCKIY